MSPRRYSTLRIPARRAWSRATSIHVGGGVDGDDALGVLGEEERGGTFSGAEVAMTMGGMRRRRLRRGTSRIPGGRSPCRGGRHGVKERCASCPGVCGGRGACGLVGGGFGISEAAGLGVVEKGVVGGDGLGELPSGG